MIKKGKPIDSFSLKLKAKDRVNLVSLLARTEESLGAKRINDFFSPSFFRSNFWYEFCTVFSFQPWHSLAEFRRYFLRFIQDFPAIDTLETVEITPFNQYDSMVLPIVAWLKKNKVNFLSNTIIDDFEFDLVEGLKKVCRIYYSRDKKKKEILVNENDYVFATIGSMTADSSLGSMSRPPLLEKKGKAPAWRLWENISKNNPEFGKPSVFNTDIKESKWTSFTVTFREPLFFKRMENFIDKRVSDYGGVNIIDSNWLISLVLSYKPYYKNQPKDITLCWGYGLYPDKVGNFVKKKMINCGGAEILTELCRHLGFKKKEIDLILETSVSIPCYMPYITSQFLPRSKGDRPAVIPKGSKNLAFIGQYCEIPDEVVFTVEYSIRSAQIAVFSLLNLDKEPSPIYHGAIHPGVVLKAIKTSFR